MPTAIELLTATRAEAGRTGPFAIGSITEFLHVGTPSSDLGERTVTGSPDAIAAHLREYADLGVTHLQVRFEAGSVDEHCEQMAAFGTDVVPLVNA